MENILSKAGRIAFGIFFIVFGVNHFLYGGKMVGMLEGWPAPMVFVYISGAALLLAGVSFLIKVQAKWAGVFLAILLVIMVATIHLPALVKAGESGMMKHMPTILKDLSLAAASLYIAGNVERTKIPE